MIENNESKKYWQGKPHWKDIELAVDDDESEVENNAVVIYGVSHISKCDEMFNPADCFKSNSQLSDICCIDKYDPESVKFKDEKNFSRDIKSLIFPHCFRLRQERQTIDKTKAESDCISRRGRILRYENIESSESAPIWVGKPTSFEQAIDEEENPLFRDFLRSDLTRQSHGGNVKDKEYVRTTSGAVFLRHGGEIILPKNKAILTNSRKYELIKTFHDEDMRILADNELSKMVEMGGTFRFHINNSGYIELLPEVKDIDPRLANWIERINDNIKRYNYRSRDDDAMTLERGAGIIEQAIANLNAEIKKSIDVTLK